MEAVQQIYRDGDPIRTMLLLIHLTDLGLKHGLADESDRDLLAQLHQLLASIATQREDDHRTPC
jgi:hypothetical protein